VKTLKKIVTSLKYLRGEENYNNETKEISVTTCLNCGKPLINKPINYHTTNKTCPHCGTKNYYYWGKKIKRQYLQKNKVAKEGEVIYKKKIMCECDENKSKGSHKLGLYYAYITKNILILRCRTCNKKQYFKLSEDYDNKEYTRLL
jgi:hypothetical protein